MDQVKQMRFSSLLLLHLFVVLCFSSVTSANLESDRKVLLAFSGSVRHSRRLNWNSRVSVCSWIGVTCTVNQTRILTLRLPGVGLLGSISPNTLGKLRDLRILSLRSNHLYGDLPSDIFSLPFLRYLSLQNNNFSGHIPAQLSSRFFFIDLSHNFLSGEIPVGITNLSQLSILYLQDNILSGSIPDLKLPKLMRLNLSNNNLNGTIPNLLQKFPVESFLGNPQLCGPPLSQCLAIVPSSPTFSPLASSSASSAERSFKKKINTGIVIAIATGISAILLLFIAVIIFCFLKRKDTVDGGKPKDKIISGQRVEKPKLENSSGIQNAVRDKLVFFESCSYIFDLEDLLRASAEVLGKGSYGTAYKASLEDGTTVVVKRLKEVVAGKKEFEQQMETIGRIGQHPNLVPLRAYYYSKDEKLLVCNYFPNRSFSSLLHENRGTDKTSVDWDSRVKIVLGTAYGIAHIHSEGGPKFTHGNIKSSNILLDQNLNPLVSDYGLCALMNPPVSRSRAFVGYRAPETIETGKITQKSDIYSFGVLLLEMLTGKSPLQSQRHDDIVDLPRWVKSIVREEWTAEVFDTELMKSPTNEEKLVQMLQLAMACLSRFPDRRPQMEEVIRTLEDIKLSGNESQSSSDKHMNSSEQTP